MEIEIDRQQVSIRQSDLRVNGTQILKIASQKASPEKCLKTLGIPFDVVSYGHWRGRYIDIDKALELCKAHGLDVLYSRLDALRLQSQSSQTAIRASRSKSQSFDIPNSSRNEPPASQLDLNDKGEGGYDQNIHTQPSNAERLYLTSFQGSALSLQEPSLSMAEEQYMQDGYGGLSPLRCVSTWGQGGHFPGSDDFNL